MANNRGPISLLKQASRLYYGGKLEEAHALISEAIGKNERRKHKSVPLDNIMREINSLVVNDCRYNEAGPLLDKALNDFTDFHHLAFDIDIEVYQDIIKYIQSENLNRNDTFNEMFCSGFELLKKFREKKHISGINKEHE